MSNPPPDMPDIRALNDFAASLRPEGFADQLTQRMEAMRAVQDEVRELRGRAESDDGLVVAAFSATEGFHGLVLDPRAMRLPSVDLAESIESVARAAREDFERQRREIVGRLGGSPAVDVDAAQREIAEVTQAATKGLGDMQALFDQFRHRMGQ